MILKIFILTVIFILLLFRIKNTPTAISKTIWTKKMLKNIEENKFLSIEPFKEEAVNLAFFIIFLFELLLIIFFIITGNYIDIKIITILTVFKIVMCFYSGQIIAECLGNIYSTDINDFKFHRIYHLLSVILDYVYYVLVILILLK